MGEDIWGGGVIIVVAAGLWLVYLVPTWLHRREYLATERNALRLQQTMRILAETSEMPREVRLEMTARSVAAQERILKHNESKARAEAKAAEVAAAGEAAAAKAAARAAADAERRRARAALASRRLLRRSRAATSLVLLAGVVTLGVGAYQLVALASWGVLAAGFVVAGGAFGVLSMLARAGRVRPAVRVAAPLAAPALYDQGHTAAEKPERANTWTPQPLPKPLYLSPGSAAAGSMASADAVTELRRAAVKAEYERRAAQVAPQPVRLPEPVTLSEPITLPEPVEGRGRFASMGILDESTDAPLDLDAVLRRRRAG